MRLHLRHPLPRLLGVAAITFGRHVLVAPGVALTEALLRHEAEHVRQWRRLGRRRFLREYLGAYLRGRRAGLGHREAYRSIPLEVEARAAEAPATSCSHASHDGGTPAARSNQAS